MYSILIYCLDGLNYTFIFIFLVFLIIAFSLLEMIYMLPARNFEATDNKQTKTQKQGRTKKLYCHHPEIFPANISIC